MENTSMTSLAPHFESILDTLSDGVFISDAEGTTLFVNKMYETLTGLRQGESRGKNIRTLVQQGIFDKVVNPQIVETGKSATHVQQLANGKRLVLTGYPVFDDKGQLCLVVTFARDITVLTQLQEEMTAQKKLIEQFHDRLAFLAREQTRELVPVFESREMKEVMSLVERFASSDATVLILGESGTGKELFAQSIHNGGRRANAPFVVVNCGALPRNLVQSELFGYDEGSFTGASRLGKPGKFELADNGTIFLDEIGEMPLEAQVSLLRLLQNGEVTRVGGKHTRLVNVRVLAATNRNLENAIRQNAFREDLYYRLNVFTLNVPPLRERSSDIALLINHFLDHFVASLGRGPLRVTDRAMDVLLGYPWPGNIRELRNVLIRALSLCQDNQITLTDLPSELRQQAVAESAGTDGKLQSVVKNSEAQTILLALGDHHWNVARALGISRASMYEKMRKFSIKRPPNGF